MSKDIIKKVIENLELATASIRNNLFYLPTCGVNLIFKLRAQEAKFSHPKYNQLGPVK
jgi:hypothetical protein